MRFLHLRHAAAAALLALPAGMPAPPPRLTVSSFTIHRTTANGTVDRTFVPSATALVSNAEFDTRLTVTGSLLDLSTGADVVNESGTVVSGTSASITDRQGGNNTHVNVTVSGLSGKAPGLYRVRIHYAVETNGPDIVKLRLLARGEVTGIDIDPSPPRAGGLLATGVTYTVRATGTRLDVAAVDPATMPNAHLTVVSRSSSALVFSVRYDQLQPGTSFIDHSAFYDENLGHVPLASEEIEMGVRYAGNGSRGFVVANVPIITSASPQPASMGNVALIGSNLTGGGYSATAVRYGHRYTSGVTSLSRGGIATENQFSGGPSSISLFLPYDVADDPLEVAFEPEVLGSPLAPITLTVPFSTRYPPSIGQVIASGEQPPIGGVRILRAGTATITGKYLFVPAAGTKSTSGGTARIATSTPGATTARFNTLALGVTSTRYVPPNGSASGVDSVRVTLADPPDNIAGQFHVDTPLGGSITPDLFVLATRPKVSLLAELTDSVPPERVVTSQTLFRGHQYQIVGSSLSIRGIPQILQTGTVKVNGMVALLQPTPDPTVALRFLVPLAATSGALVVSTAGGETTVGTFLVTDPPSGTVATPRPVSLTISPPTVAAGVGATGSLTLDNPGSSVSGFTVALTSSDTSAATVPPTVSTATTSASFSITSKSVSAPRTVTITATSGGASQTRSLTVNLPAPTGLALVGNDVVSGTPVTGTLTFTAAATGATVSVSSSDAAVQVPASVTASGSTATFALTTTEAPAPRTVTVNASANGATKSATVTVTPLRIVSVSSTRDTLRAGQTATITATTNRALTGNAPLTVANTQPSLVAFDAPNLRLPSGQTSGTIGLRVLQAPTAPTSVTITISRSVVTAAFGTITTSATRNVVVVP